MYVMPDFSSSAVSVNLSWHCNLRCDFCIVPPERLSDRTKLDIDVLKANLDEINLFSPIRHIEIFGGEVGILPPNYVSEVISLLKTYRPEALGLVTNLTSYPDFMNDPDLYIAVSYDGSAREHADKTLRNMQSMSRPFAAMLLVTPRVLGIPIDKMIGDFNSCPNLSYVKIIPYFPNQANDVPVSDQDYENYVAEFIKKSSNVLIPKLKNTDQLERKITTDQNAVSTDRIYITPKGQLACALKDKNGLDYLEFFSDYPEYICWASDPTNWQVTNPTCLSCDYLNSCDQAHLFEQHRDIRSCSGHRNLIKWYQETYHASNGQ